MSPAIQTVQRHLNAVWNSDWKALTSSLADKPELFWQIGKNERHSEQEASGMYRSITQAWDFLPGSVELEDHGDGIVEAKMYLTNAYAGGHWAKKVRGDYHVSGDRIDRIMLCDDVAFEVSRG